MGASMCECSKILNGTGNHLRLSNWLSACGPTSGTAVLVRSTCGVAAYIAERPLKLPGTRA